MKIALKAELESVDRQIADLNQKREAIIKLLSVYGFETILAAVDTLSQFPTEGRTRGGLNTLEMARLVIRNAARPLKPEAIKEGIRKTYGVEPAKTICDMLWKRARSKDSGFFREKTGEIGLTEMIPQMETVSTSIGTSRATSAVA